MFGKLLLLFILVPAIELYLFFTIGKELGLFNTVVVIIMTAIIGAALTKSQGRQVLANFQNATASGKIPAKEALDGVLILIAGAVLLTPGFLTDVFGFLLLIPPARNVIRNFLAKRLKGKVKIITPQTPASEKKTKSSLDDGSVIDI